MTERPTFATKVRKLIVEPDDDGFLVMDEDGNVTRHDTPEQVVAAARKTSGRDLRTGTGMVTTAIEWRDMPDDFKPPEVS